MINEETLRQHVAASDFRNLSQFYKEYKPRLLELVLQYFMVEPSISDPTFDFVLNSEKGKRKVAAYIDLFGEAIQGQVDLFITGQQNAGIENAREGSQIGDALGFLYTFKKALWQCIVEHNSTTSGVGKRIDLTDFQIVDFLCEYADQTQAKYFTKTAKEIIVHNADRLVKLQKFTTDMVYNLSEEKVFYLARMAIIDIYNLQGEVLVFQDDRKITDSLKTLSNILQEDLETLIEKATHFQITLVGDHADKIFTPDDQLVQSDKFTLKFIIKPINDTKRSAPLGVFILHDRGHYFTFTKFEKFLLDQLASFVGAVTANCRMTSEIEEKRKELGLLAGRLISIQEAERKRIAAVMHDTVVQTMAGVGYKALYCQQLIHKHPDKLENELDLLITNINSAIKESREVIKKLRPPVLDGVGIMAAFNDLLNEFKGENNIDIKFTHPKVVQIDSHKATSLYRILQESLVNIKKHSAATMVSVSVKYVDEKKLMMEIADNGRGLPLASDRKSHNKTGVGLLIMRERIEELQGKLYLTSEIGKGCKISAVIPLQDGEANE
ncbi:MAG: sensor histidine kinase [Syntrophales bacterium]|nr:sensor histidine kinase [Syntrophales bacterium]